MNFEEYLIKLLAEFKEINDFNLIVLIILSISLVIQLSYYLFVYTKLNNVTKTKQTKANKEEIEQKKVQFPISVVISARNEAQNLNEFLPVILEQDYPNYEVIVVNDCSEDNSEEILSKMKIKYKHLYVTNIRKDEKFSHGKKLALTIGIKAAKNEYLLLTDADCKPVSKHWISEMQSKFSAKHEIVLGYGGYFPEKSLVNLFIRTDTVFIAMQYISFARIGFPYMGVGRNLAYKKSLFFENKGFSKHIHINSGDDDLFINEVAKKSNTTVQYSQESFTLSVPNTTFQQWINQKRRHLKTGKHYKKRYKLLLGGEIGSRFLFFISTLLLFFSKIQLLIFVTLFVFIIRTLIQLVIFRRATEVLKESKIVAFFILYDIVQPLINLSVYLSNTLSSKKKKWR